MALVWVWGMVTGWELELGLARVWFPELASAWESGWNWN
jgi:hypothetical protein